MASFEIAWKRSAARELRKLPAAIMSRIIAAVEGLAAETRTQPAPVSWRAPITLTGFEKVLIESSMKLMSKV